MKRLCDICKSEYNVKQSDLDRGWGLTCSKSCAAKKREESKEGYNIVTVEKNNMKRELWFNKYRKQELSLRRRKPKWSDSKIWNEMYRLTKDEIFLSNDIKDTFIF